MEKLRLGSVVLALVLPTIALRLGGGALWTVYAAGLTVTAAIAVYALWQDELLSDVMVPKGFDLSAGVLPAVLLVAAITWFHAGFVAPAGELGGLLRKCALDGPRFPRSDVHGVARALEWVRGEVCRSYGTSLGVTGTTRMALVVLVATLEELTWRGGVQQLLSEKLGSTRGWLAASLLFGLAHVPTGHWLLALLALGCGLLWGALYRYRGRLVPSLLSHALFSYTLFHARPLVDFT